MSSNSQGTPPLSAIRQSMANAPLVPDFSGGRGQDVHLREMEYHIHVLFEKVEALEADNEIMKEVIEELENAR